MSADEIGRCSPGFVQSLYSAWERREVRLDQRAGVIAATIANAAGARKVGDRPYEPHDFFSSLADQIDFPDQDMLERKIAAGIGGIGG